MAFLPLNALSEELCFEQPAAQLLYAKIKTADETEKKLLTLIDKYSQEFDADQFIVENLAQSLSLLEEQVEDANERGDRYKLEWQKAGDALIDCQKSKPSRWTWFSIGAGSGIGFALLLILL